MSLLEYYEPDTRTLTLPWDFNECINKDNLPNDVLIIIFKNERNNMGYYSKFNQPVDSLPNSITNLTLGFYFNQSVMSLPNSIIELGFYSNSSIKDNLPDFIETVIIYFIHEDIYNYKITNLPYNLKKIKINDPDKKHYIIKIPFDCILTDLDDNVI